MDPPIINLTSFSAANPSAYSLAEIWPCPINGNVVGSGGGLGLRMSNLTGFCDSASNRDFSMDESTVTEQSGSRSGGGGGGGGKKRRDASSGDDESSNLSGNDLNNSDGKRMKLSRSRVENGGSNSKSKMESNSGQGNMAAEKHTKPSEQLNKQDYIHVRARRGQATDSHSLAERARREKIGERMKILQDLVPGCNKVPHVTRTDYQLIDISEDGFVSLLTENGNTKDDLKLPTDESLLSQIKDGFAEGKDLIVSVMCAMGEEQINALKDIGPKN